MSQPRHQGCAVLEDPGAVVGIQRKPGPVIRSVDRADDDAIPAEIAKVSGARELASIASPLLLRDDVRKVSVVDDGAHCRVDPGSPHPEHVSAGRHDAAVADQLSGPGARAVDYEVVRGREVV